MLKAEAVTFNKEPGRNEVFGASEGWVWWWKVLCGLCQFSLEGEFASNDSKAAEYCPKLLRYVVKDDGYTDGAIVQL
jgi:hypothetical protein